LAEGQMMILDSIDSYSFVQKELNQLKTISPSKRIHFYSKNLIDYSVPMIELDMQMSLIWTSLCLKFLNEATTGPQMPLLFERCCRNTRFFTLTIKDFNFLNLIKDQQELVIVLLEKMGQNRKALYLKAEFSLSENIELDRSWAEPDWNHKLFDSNNEIYNLLFRGEPYMAWQILLLKTNNSIATSSLSPLIDPFVFSLIAPSEVILSQIRKGNFIAKAEDLAIRFLILSAKGEFSWTTDRVCKKYFYQYFEKPKDPLSLLINRFFKLIQFSEERSLNSNLKIRFLFFETLEHIFCQNLPLLNCEFQLFTFAILAKTLKSLRQSELHKFMLHYFHKINLHLSKGHSEDIWNLMSGAIELKKFKSQGTPLPDQIDIIPVGIIKRSLAGVSFTTNLAKILGPKRMIYLITGQHYKLKLLNNEKIQLTESIAAKLSELKGPLMKAGQTMSYTKTNLPPQLARVFSQLQKQSAPVDFGTMMNQIKKLAPQQLLEHLIEIEPESIGTGSIGQVYKARLKSGDIVAVKIKYPEIESIVKVDFLLLKALGSLLKLIFPQYPIFDFLKTLEKGILRECDYIQEAESIQRFNERFDLDPHIRIPMVYRQFSNQEILVTSFETGLDFEQINTQSEDQKLFWAQTLVRFVVSSCRDGDFNSDPHPGNFLFAQDQLICLDFGSTQRWSANQQNAWNHLIMASVENDSNHILKAIDLMGAHSKNSKKKISELLKALTLNTRDQFWTHNKSQTIAAENLVQQLNEIFSVQQYFKMPTEILFGLRVYFGHLAIVSMIGSEHNWHQMVKQLMSEWQSTNH
jgi:predicted unusual protein kinase regulating ubiquinone biosynthesis (AarF/ABC1/UbiB family)